MNQAQPPSSRSFTRSLSLLLSPLLLVSSACAEEDGNGGGTEVPGDNAYCTEAADWSDEFSDFEAEVLEHTNDARAAGQNCGGTDYPPVGPLSMEGRLQCAARVHSKDMVDRDFFDHENPDKEGPGERATQAGYNWSTFGENIAAGQPTPEAVVQSWLSSPGHCTNIMSGDFIDFGAGVYRDESGTLFWTQVFGASF